MKHTHIKIDRGDPFQPDEPVYLDIEMVDTPDKKCIETIEIIQGHRAWDAKFSDPAIRAALGTDTIQTPFLLAMPRATVVEKIQTLNPTCKVF